MNTRKWFLSVVVVVVVGVTATLAWAESPLPFQWRGSTGWEPQSAYCRLYDTHTRVTLHGTVQRIDKIIPMEGMGAGMYLALKTDSEIIPVHLGPVWFVERQDVQFHTGDVVDVSGSRIVCQGKPAILAAVIQRGDDTVTFRTLNGKPAWTLQKP